MPKPANPYSKGTVIWEVMEGDREDLTVTQIAQVLNAVPGSIYNGRREKMAESVAYNMDCMEAMRQMPDKCFGLAVVDPPYGIGAVNMRRGNSVIAADSGKHWDDDTPTEEYFSELFRVSRNQIVFGGNYFSLPPTRCILVWDKGETMYGRSFAELEMAWTSFDESARLFKYNPADPARIHPTQKPVALYAWIFQKYAKPGDRILDTHLGSGSSRIAAHDAGLDFVGFELDKHYFEAQEERFAAHIAQCSLFV